eukprot:GHRR01001937.1.p1 GENE.GHRR01001937.1~~GHRR01001937.1.p1  ORF type:complete len:418 (+),score=128.96 GHRR01001937.1:210-1463(+)
MHCHLHANRRAVVQTRSSSTCAPTVQRPCRSSRVLSAATSKWKVFGPAASYSDGDAEFFRLSNQLADQYEWFAPRPDQAEEPEQQQEEDKPLYGLTPKQIAALGLSGARVDTPDPATLSSRAYMRGERFDPSNPAGLGFSARAAAATSSSSYRAPSGSSRRYSGARAAYGDYPNYPEGRPIFLPEAERFGNPPDLPSLLLQQRVIYISMPFLPSVTELVVAQCYYLDFDDKNRNKPIYVYLNSTGCINEKNQAVSADNEFYAIWAALGFTRAPLYTGVTWKAQNQAAVLLAAGQKGHRYTFPHAKISTSPPIMNRVFGQTVDAQLQANELEYATKYYAAILARSTGKDLATCQKEYLSRKRYFSVKEAYEEGLVDKLVPGYKMNRFRKIAKDALGTQQGYFGSEKPKFRFTRQQREQ